MHQPADVLHMSRRLQRIDAECAKALRGVRRGEEVTEAGSWTALSVLAGRLDPGGPQ